MGKRRARPPRTRRVHVPLPGHGLAVVAWAALVLAGLAALVANAAGTGPERLADAGAVTVSTAYAWGLAARTGTRPFIFTLLVLVLGLLVGYSHTDLMRSGAAVLTAVETAVFAVMVTVPAVHFIGAVRENLVALVVAVIGAMATVAWSPTVSLDRFEYVALGLSLAAAFVMVFRLGAGFHGLGARGVVTVLAGSLLLALTLGYAELLRRYGTPGLVHSLFDFIRWSRDHAGAFPRPIVALLGVPALTWGTHMRARRRQGWWVCAFGVALTGPVAYSLLDPDRSVAELGLATAYGLVVGLVIGFVLIRADLALTAPRGRRAHDVEEATAVRPEPGRTQALW